MSEGGGGLVGKVFIIGRALRVDGVHPRSSDQLRQAMDFMIKLLDFLYTYFHDVHQYPFKLATRF